MKTTREDLVRTLLHMQKTLELPLHWWPLLLYITRSPKWCFLHKVENFLRVVAFGPGTRSQIKAAQSFNEENYRDRSSI